MSNAASNTMPMRAREVTLAEEMAAYDSLPADARKEIRELPVQICSAQLADDIRNGAPAHMLADWVRQWRRNFMALPRALRGWPE